MDDDPAGREDAPATLESADGTTGTASPLVFLLGLVVFVASVLAFLADLVTGHAIVRGLLANAGSAVLLVWWAAADTLSDPDSEVTTRTGAAGTGLLLLGIYLLAASAVVGLTSPFHGRLDLVPWSAGVGVVFVVAGFVVFPTGTVIDGRGEAETPDAGDEQ